MYILNLVNISIYVKKKDKLLDGLIIAKRTNGVIKNKANDIVNNMD
jgi:hypothetical protein